MNRRVTWWLMVTLVLVLDVVTVVFHLLAPPWQGILLGASGVVIAAFLAIRVLDWRMQRRHRREAYAAPGFASASAGRAALLPARR
ncbi:MAG TPA: hypothetical protein VFR81_07615 [Longimicrobium sp.]|nr:hypothetical protein [Longimicrobium sp.]